MMYVCIINMYDVTPLFVQVCDINKDVFCTLLHDSSLILVLLLLHPPVLPQVRLLSILLTPFILYFPNLLTSLSQPPFDLPLYLPL